jgi:hypothetical protein
MRRHRGPLVIPWHGALSPRERRRTFRQNLAISRRARHEPTGEEKGGVRAWGRWRHDLPYRFTVPTAMPQVLAWAKLLARRAHGEFPS